MHVVLRLVVLWALLPSVSASEVPGLVGHWKLAGDLADASGSGLAAVGHGVTFAPGDPHGSGVSARFGGSNGGSSYLEVPAAPALRMGTDDFTVAFWIRTDASSLGDPGDLVSLFDPERRVGFQVALRTNTGVTGSQPNTRQLQFGIDAGSEPAWDDLGRPGNAVLAFALAVHEGALYAGTCANRLGEVGRVFRYDGPSRWTDCGPLDGSNAVTALAVHNGALYAGTGHYRFAGSALPESPNSQPGGRILRYEADDRWTEVGQLPKVEAVGGLVTFRGRLHASSMYAPAGFFRQEADGKWTSLPVPEGRRVEALAVHDGALYASSWDGGRVYRYDGEAWSDLGRLGENTQTYAFTVHQGRLCAGTWPSGRVYRLDESGPDRWVDLGRLGQEREVMGLMVHNGKLYGGTLPAGEVYRHEDGQRWTRVARLDTTPAVKYHRVWAMAEHAGRLCCSTLPSGHVHALRAGVCTTSDRPLHGGWRHVAAVRGAGVLRLFVDGAEVARSSPFEPSQFDLSTDQPLRLGVGAGGAFRGRMSDVRVYRRALSAAEIVPLATR